MLIIVQVLRKKSIFFSYYTFSCNYVKTSIALNSLLLFSVFQLAKGWTFGIVKYNKVFFNKLKSNIELEHSIPTKKPSA